MKIRDRIKELRRVPSKELQPHPKNWRAHPDAQKNALRGMLAEVGIAGVCVAYQSDRYGGLTLIDGHLRAEEDATWPTVILDVTDEEADKLLVTFDMLADQAEVDTEQLEALLAEVHLENDAAQAMLDEFGEFFGLGDKESSGNGEESRPEILAGATLKDLAPTDEEMAILQGRRVLVEFSGGKDSSAAAIWARHYLPDAEIELCFCDMGADFVGFNLFLHKFADWLGCKLVTLRSDVHMIDRFLQKGEWPHFMFPYCQEILHEVMDKHRAQYDEDDVVMVRGGRKQESSTQQTKRRSRKRERVTDCNCSSCPASEEVEKDSRWLKVHRLPGYRFFQPLYLSDKASSEAVLAEVNAPVWEGYSRGLKRTACRCCPGQRPRAYAAMRREFPDVWAELLVLQEKLGPGCWQGRDGEHIPTLEEAADKGDQQLSQEGEADWSI